LNHKEVTRQAFIQSSIAISENHFIHIIAHVVLENLTLSTRINVQRT
jgi:hypothetical protein